MKADEYFSAWIDNELSEKDRIAFEAANDPVALTKARLDAENLGKMLRSVPVPRLDAEDLFHAEIMRAIATAEPPLRRSLFDWLFPFLLPATAALCLFGASTFLFTNTAAEQSEVLTTISPNTGVTAVAFHVPKSEITVIWMDGLDAIDSNPPLN